MWFKRKSLGGAPAMPEPAQREVRQRHRLSKPQTSKSSTNLAVLATQQSASQSTLSVHSETPISPIMSTAPTYERRTAEKTRPFSTVHEEEIISTTANGEKKWHRTTVVINAAESRGLDRDSPSPVPLQVQKARRPFSAIFGSRRTSNTPIASRNFSFEDSPISRKASMASLNSTAPVEAIAEGAPRVLQRRASFTPGAATRTDKVPSREQLVPQLRRDTGSEVADKSQLCQADKAYFYDETRSPVSPLSQLEVLDFERDWEPPPHVERSTTPLDLDYHYLGGLRLGSLRVTNGRASPAPSELSKHLLHRPSALLHRDASSEYGSDVGSIRRTHTPPPSSWKPPKSREVSQSRQLSSSLPRLQSSRDVSYGSDSAFSAQSHANGQDLPSPTIDRTVTMARSYMAEVPNSPFSVVASQPSSPYTPQQRSSPFDSGSETVKRRVHETEEFEDETVGESQGSEEDRDTISTCRTPSDAASHRVNPFDRYDNLRERPSQGNPQPPQNGPGETSDSGYSSNASLHSAKNERQTLVAQRVKMFEQPRAESAAAQLPAAVSTTTGDQTAGSRPFRNSFLKFHRKTAPESVPTMADFNHSSTSVAISQTTASTASSRPKTPSKRLQKKRRSSQPAPPDEIMVTGVHAEDHSTIPPIPQHQTNNLMLRSQQLPELQRTFRSNHHTKNSLSNFDLALKPAEIRFPSPTPELDSEEESAAQNKTSPPKRNSFIARATRRASLQGRKSVERPSSGISEAEAQSIVQHFGCTAGALGGSPYDIASAAGSKSEARTPSRQGAISPHKITRPQSPIPDRRRLTMDDRTASEFARNRSKALARLNRQSSIENLKRLEHERRAAMNESGGIHGNRPRPHSVQPGMMGTVRRKPLPGGRPFQAPPRPDTPQRDERASQLASYWPQQQPEQYDAPTSLPARRSPRPEQHQYMQQHESPVPQSHYWDQQQRPSQPSRAPPPIPSSPSPGREQYEQYYESPAPLPPRHSPRPSFMEPQDDIEEMALPPPPPSHSPRPMDISASAPQQDAWAAQAEAWRERRKSVGEFLGFNSDDLHYRETDHDSVQTTNAVIEDDLEAEEDLYPVIPPRESQTAYTPHEEHSPYPTRQNIWQPAARHHDEVYEPDFSRRTPAETFQDPATAYLHPVESQYQYQYPSRPSSSSSRSRPLPKPRSRPISVHSQAPSMASSLAEELHPVKDERPTVPPDFGRYSGGLQYEFERGKGFGGSAGTRTVSGKAAGVRKSVPLSAGFGVDLSDVPILVGLHRL